MHRLVPFIALVAAVALAAPAQASDAHIDLYYDIDSPAANNRLDLYLPDGTDRSDALPLIVYVHGGGWSTGDKRNRITDKVALFNGAGYAFASVNYRLSPRYGDPARPDPRRVRFPAHPHDVGEALGWLDRHAADYGADSRRMVLVGHSAGAQIVSLVASDPRYARAYGVEGWQLAAAVSLDTDAFDIAAEADPASPEANNPEQFWNAFATPAENAADSAWDRGSPLRWADSGDPPFLLVTSLIPNRRADNERMAAALGQDPGAMLALPYDHERINTALGASDDTAGETEAVMSFIRRELSRARASRARLRGHPPRRLRAGDRRVLARFRFAAPRAGTFECRLDGADWRRCRSPKRYRVAGGRHVFRVRALTERGRPGPVESWRFRVIPRH